MQLSLDEVELAFAVDIATLRRILRSLQSGGRRWWIACEPEHSLAAGYVTVGYGDPGCADRLNTLYYRFPLLNTDMPSAGPDKLVVLVDSSVLRPEQPGLYRDGDRVLGDELVDLEDMLSPIERALVRAKAGNTGMKTLSPNR